MVLSDLYVFSAQGRQLCSAQTAAEKNGKDGSVSPTLQRLSVWRLQQAPALNPRSANCQAHTEFPGPLSLDTGG